MVDPRMLRTGASRLVIASVLAGALLCGCKPNAQAPNAQAPSAAPSPLAAIPLAASSGAAIAPAPASSALPDAPAARVGRLANRGDYYAFADQAYAMNSGFGDAPPDYTFDYGGGERPWVWRGDDQSMRVAEPLPDGGDRYYYYEPGSDAPYLVRDQDYSYGYQNGVLVVIYDRSGRALPPDALDRRADMAGRFLARARAIHQASLQRQREAVAEAHWAERRSQIDADRAQWASSQAADRDWSAYHAAHEQDDRARWDAERYRREAEAARFDQSINDNQAAQRDWQAAERAQGRAAANGQAPSPQPVKPSGPLGFGPKPPSAPPVAPPPPPAAPPTAPPALVVPPHPPAGPNGQPHAEHHGPSPVNVAPSAAPPTQATPSTPPRPVFDHKPAGAGQGAPNRPTPQHPPQAEVQHGPVAPVTPPHAPTAVPTVAPRHEPPHINPPIAPPHIAPPATPVAPHREPPHLSPSVAPPRVAPAAPATPHVGPPASPPAAHVVKPPAAPPPPADKHPEHRRGEPNSSEPPGAH